jgi:hypothetical protein
MAFTFDVRRSSQCSLMEGQRGWQQAGILVAAFLGWMLAHYVSASVL